MKVLFYYDQLADSEQISGGVSVILRSLIQQFKDHTGQFEFVFAGNKIQKAEKSAGLVIINASELDLGQLLAFDVIVVIDRIGALAQSWHSLGRAKRILYMHSWEIQEQMLFFDKIVCISEKHKSWLVDQGIQHNKLEIIENGVDFSEFKDFSHIQKIKNSILTVGAVIEHKGTHIIIEAAKQLKASVPDLTLTVVGSAALWNQPTEYQENLKKNSPDWVKFVEPVSRSDLSFYYSSSSIICSASKRETFGLVAVEAQGFGCVPVSFDTGGVSSTMLDGKTGLLYSPNTPEALSRAISKCLSDIDNGLISRSVAKDFAFSQRSVSKMAQTWMELLDKIVQSPKAISAQQVISGGFSFCIISGGNRQAKIYKLIESIKQQKLDNFEIIIAGKLAQKIEDVRYIELVNEAEAGRTSVMRNRAMQETKYNTIVMCDDDIVLDQGFAEAIANHGKEFDVLCVKVRSPDGSRYWDWATVGGPTGHRLLDYKENDDYVYVSSAIFVISKKTLKLGYFDENRGFYAAEDVEFSQRLKALGASIEICSNAKALHDDNRYTQFDDYPRRYINFHNWEDISEGVSAKAVYAWDGRAYPLPKDMLLRLVNCDSNQMSFEFNIVPLSPDAYNKAWNCQVIHGESVIAQTAGHANFNFSLLIKPYTSAVIQVKCSDTAVAFCQGAFRDQRAVAAYMLKPLRRQPKSSDIIISSDDEINISNFLNQQGLAIFAGCMNFSDFASNTRALIRDLYSKNTSLGLELHANDFWFSQLCLGFDSSKHYWSKLIKQRYYNGINMVCADARVVEHGFFRRAISSRPGFSTNIAITTSSRDSQIIEELSQYSDVFTFSYEDCKVLLEQGIKSRLLSPKRYFIQDDLTSPRKLPNQRSQAVTFILDQFSDYEALFLKSLQDYSLQDDISIVLYVVDKLAVLQQLVSKVQFLLQSSGQENRISQVVVTAGTLEAAEELEFLKFSLKLYNLLTSPKASRLDLRLST